MSVQQLVSNINAEIINPLILLLFAIATIVFMFGLVEFIASADSEQGKQKGRQHMLWGIIGMVIMVAAKGLVWLVVNTFRLPPPSGI